MKFSFEYKHALNTFNVNYVEVLKIDAAVIFPKTVIVYYPICSNKSLYQATYLEFSSKVINAEEILEVK
jgi:hypothetical protein